MSISWCVVSWQVYERHLYTGVRTTDPEEIVTYDSQRIPIRVKFTLTYEIQDPSKASQFRSKDSDGAVSAVLVPDSPAPGAGPAVATSNDLDHYLKQVQCPSVQFI